MKDLVQSTEETMKGCRVFTPKAPFEIKKADELKLGALHCIRDLVEIEMKDAGSSVRPHLKEAYTAAEKYGAQLGVGEGLTGVSYALPTMDAEFGVLSLGDIREHVDDFKDFAYDSPDLEFYVTRVGCGIAGYSDSKIAPLFVGSPSNCTFDPQWSSYGLPAWKEVM